MFKLFCYWLAVMYIIVLDNTFIFFFVERVYYQHYTDITSPKKKQRINKILYTSCVTQNSFIPIKGTKTSGTVILLVSGL